MNRSRNTGFSLVEVLVSILVLALGAIGAAGIQLTALRTSQQSGLQSTALQLATELADRMRVNYRQMQLADDENRFLSLDFQAADGPPAPTSADCFSEHCNEQQLAEFDLYTWQQRLATSLPGARAVVCRDAGVWNTADNRLTWDCVEDGAASLVIKIGWAQRDPTGVLVEELDGGPAPAVALLVAPYAL